MRRRNDNVNDSEGSLLDMSENQIEELEAEISSPPSHKPTPTPSSSRKKTQAKHARKPAEFIADGMDDESVDKKQPTKSTKKSGKAKTKSASIEVDDGELAGEVDEPKPTTKKTLARSGRGVAKVMDKTTKASTKAKPPSAKTPAPKKATPENDGTGTNADAPPSSLSSLKKARLSFR